jgi:hypothetical protein
MAHGLSHGIGKEIVSEKAIPSQMNNCLISAAALVGPTSSRLKVTHGAGPCGSASSAPAVRPNEDFRRDAEPLVQSANHVDRQRTAKPCTAVVGSLRLGAGSRYVPLPG